MTGFLARISADPFGAFKRALFKTILGPLRYSRGEGYDAEAYWRDRFSKHGQSLRGPGHEGVSEEENRAMYSAAAELFVDYCESQGITLRGKKVLEIGCGTGFYTRLCQKCGVASYTGLDITDVNFSELRREFPTFTFTRADITVTQLLLTYDVVLMIDVLEHIVEEKLLEQALTNVRRSIATGGVFLAALPTGIRNRRSLFYLRFWPETAIVSLFPGYQHCPSVPFRYGRLFAIRDPGEGQT